MAGAYSATFRFPVPTTITSATIRRFRLNPLRASSNSTPFPSKRTRRKNHLRPKILKTLTKPFPTAPLPQIVPVEITVPNPIPFLPENDAVFDTHSDEIPCESLPPGEAGKVFEEFPQSETIGTVGEQSGIIGKISAKSVLKFGGFLAGIFLFQTIFAVLVVGDTDSSEKKGRLNNFEGKGSILPNGSNVGYFDETEMEEKISEIRAMAREAREKEKMERKEGNEESDIEKEIGARLARLEKRLNSKREILPESFMNYLGLFGNHEEEEEEKGIGDNSLESKEDHKTLMFKKKLRFKSPSMNSRTSPKGFSGSRGSGSPSSKSGSNQNGESRKSDSGTMKVDSRREDISTPLNSSKINGNKLRKEEEDLPKEIQSGAVQDTSEGRSSSEVANSWQSRDLEKQISQSLTTENQRTITKFDGPAPASSSSNGSRGPGKRQVANKVGDKEATVLTNLWWTNLPYVLAILMRGSSEREEPAGLYTLPSQADDQEDSSYMVAFEDRGDANNFCYLLESNFEDLGEFSVDIVPLSVKELHEAVKSHSKKVIVVKKGQLKLYAGQPIAEVEMALHSLVE